MSDFELFDQLFETQPPKPIPAEVESFDEDDAEVLPCMHASTSETSGVILCIDCGEEIGKNINHDKEWRYYGQMDTKHSSDPNRCQMRKIEDKSIFKDVL